MSGGITVKEFKHIPGVNDAEYIEKLEELREIDKGIISTAVAKIKKLSAQPERLTDDDFETIRIHLNACKEKLANQHRWKEAEEYQRIIDRFMAFASAHPDVPEADRWIPVTKDMPEEKDTWFAKLWGTAKWSEFMFRRKSELVEITVELEDGTRYTDASRTHDGKWDVEERHGAVKKKVVAWHYMSEPWKGEQE